MFGLDDSLLFAPTDLDVNLTPQAVEVRTCVFCCSDFPHGDVTASNVYVCPH